MRRAIRADPTLHAAGNARRALIDAALTHGTIGAFYEVYNNLRHGFFESVYAEALSRELVSRGMRVEREVPLHVRYKGEVVGVFRADMVVESRLLLELKSTPSILPVDRTQVLNYLRATDLEVGLLLCFGRRATFQRVEFPNQPATNPP